MEIAGRMEKEERIEKDEDIEKNRDIRCLNGKQYIGKYVIIRKLGQGGEGKVYLAKDEAFNRLVAVKGMGEKRSEADFLKSLKHPMLPMVYDLLRKQGWYLVMEYIQGITLREYIDRQGAVDEEKAREWAEQMLDILEYLHTRKPPVIYRDLKPDNLMVCPDGCLRLVDFGAANRRAFGAKVDVTMAVTPGFGAPEQLGMRHFASDEQTVETTRHYAMTEAYADERSDIYAFGKVLFYMVTGADPAKPPYTLVSIRDYRPLLSDPLEQIIRKCVREEPSKRYQVVKDIRNDLSRCGSGKTCLRRRSFIRIIEKSVWLTEK